MNKVYAVYGSGGYAREVMPLVRDLIGTRSQVDSEEFVFIDDFASEGAVVNGSKIVSFDSFLTTYQSYSLHCCIAIADGNVRKRLTEKCLANGIEIISVRSLNSVVMDEVDVGKGAILSPFVTLTSNVVIGESFHANIYSYVAHDCVVGDFVTFAPGVKCNGNVRIGDGAYIGTGAIIHPGTKDNPLLIGDNAKVAAGAVVTKSVPPNVTVIGSPARVLTRELLKAMREEK